MYSIYKSYNVIDSLKYISKWLIRLSKSIFSSNNKRKAFFYYYSPLAVRKKIWKKNKLHMPHFNNDYFQNAKFSNEIKEMWEQGITKIKVNNIDILNEILNFKKEKFNYKYSIASTSKIFNEIITKTCTPIVSEYYGKPALTRENPTFQYWVKRGFNSWKIPSSIFHTDGYRQVSAMLLLNDLDQNDIHMEYCLKSHKDLPPTFDRDRILQEKVPQVFQVKKLIGKKGDIFIFDATGLHRAFHNLDVGFKNDYRALIHQNFHFGLY